MNILQLIASNSYITLNKSLIKLFKMEGAAIIGMFASIANYNNNDWFYVTYERIDDELGLSKHQASKAIEEIVKAGILIDKREGIPCRRYFKFQEVQLFNSLSLKNLTTSRKEDLPQDGQVFILQADEKLNDINKNKDNNKFISLPAKSFSRPSLEDCIAHAKREKFSINVEKFYKFYFVDSDKKYRSTWQQLMRTWAEKPSNQIPVAKEYLVTESKEAQSIRYQIERLFFGTMEYRKYFEFSLIEKDSSGWKIVVNDKNALKHEEKLKTINVKIEVK